LERNEENDAKYKKIGELKQKIKDINKEVEEIGKTFDPIEKIEGLYYW